MCDTAQIFKSTGLNNPTDILHCALPILSSSLQPCANNGYVKWDRTWNGGPGIAENA